MKDKDLWERLRAYDFPLSGGRGSLRDHLAQKTKLGSSKAPHVIEEYRRFLYLAATSGEVLAPSPLIDRVWDTHIEDTRAYLEDFSGKVMGRVIHHSPGRTKAADDPAYRRTLELYAREFEEEPFARVWPSQAWLQGENRRGLAIFAALILPMVLSPAMKFPLPFVAWPAVFGLSIYINHRWGAWSVSAASDGSGCSACGGGDGGCGGD